MASKLTWLWRFLENRPGITAVRSEWEKLAGAGLAAVEKMLQPLPEPASSYPNPRPEGLHLRVVRHRDGKIVAVCQEGSGLRIELSPRDTVRYQLDLRGLRKVIADALKLEIGKTPIPVKATVIRIGSWRPKPSAEFPVYLVLVNTTARLIHEIRGIISEAKKSPILLAPTADLWNENIQGFVTGHKSILVPLTEVIRYDGQGFQADPVWDQHLQAFCHQIELQLPSNFTNTKHKRRRTERAEAIDAIKQAIKEHLRAARDHAVTTRDLTGVAKLLPRPEQQLLAEQLKLSPSAVSRALDDDDKELKILWDGANDIDFILKYRG